MDNAVMKNFSLSTRNGLLIQAVLSLLISIVLGCSNRSFADDLGYPESGKLALNGITANATVVPEYAKFELTLDVSATYTNAFDPDQIDIGANFVSPSKETMHVNGFLYQDYNRSLVGTREVLTPLGAPTWLIRFAPDEIGQWSYIVSVTDSSGTVHSLIHHFEVVRSSNPGFVRVSKTNPAMFAFDNGQPFFPIGENACWAWKGGTFAYDDWLSKLSSAGGNWIRVWMGMNDNRIEWTRAYGGTGLGQYDLANAWRDDRILDIANSDGIYAMLCFGTYGEFNVGGFFNEGIWSQNPYNAANGGPCQTPADFWTNPTAIKLYEQRLRYITARYGYRTGLQSWELWNEAHAPAAWVSQIAQYLKGTGSYSGHPADPYRHLITTTYGDPDVWAVPEIDWTETHAYGSNGDVYDCSPVIQADANNSMAYGKPHLMAEFGIAWQSADTAYDPSKQGVNLHNGIWESATSGDAGSAMPWYWDTYIDPDNLYHEFTPLAKITKDLPWTAGRWHQLSATSLTVPTATSSYSDLQLQAGTVWQKAPQTNFVLGPDTKSSLLGLPGYLYSPSKPDLYTTLTIAANYAIPGQLIIHVEKVSSRATLQFSIDGVLVKSYALNSTPPTDGSTPMYKSTVFDPQYKIYVATFDQDYAVDVPAGKHAILINVLNGDWLSASSYTLTNIHSSRYPNVSVTGTAYKGTALLWIQNLEHNWKNVLEGKTMTTIHQGTTWVSGLPVGKYVIDWYDTESGLLISRDYNRSTAYGLELNVPDFSTDIAAKIRLQQL